MKNTIKRQIIRFLIAILFTIGINLFSSCDKFYFLEFKVLNNTSEQIIVDFSEYWGQIEHSIPINSGETKIIYEDDLAGKCNKVGGENNCPPYPIDSLSVYIWDFRVLKKDSLSIIDFNDINLWEFTTIDGLGTYTLTINESDFN